MGSPFDKMQKACFRAAKKTFGYLNASWQKSGGDPIFCDVLFKDPTETQKLLGVEYEPGTFIMEYLRGDFPGLFEMVRGKQHQIIVIDGNRYTTKFAETTFDGKTIKIHLNTA